MTNSATAGRVFLLTALFMFAAAVLPVQDAAAAARKKKADPVTHVYFIRGFLNIFSTGFDGMAKQLKDKGIKAEVHGHLSGSTIRARIKADAKATGRKPNPIVLIGHSFGGNAALATAAALGRDGINVDLVITVDPTASGPLSPSVRRYVNYYIPNNGLGTDLKSASLGRRIKNVNLREREDVWGVGDGHWTVTTNKAMEKEIMGQILAKVRR